jgi:hypothetical protein
MPPSGPAEAGSVGAAGEPQQSPIAPTGKARASRGTGAKTTQGGQNRDLPVFGELRAAILELPPEQLPVLLMVLLGLVSEKPIRFGAPETLAAISVSKLSSERQQNGDLSLTAITAAGGQWILRMKEPASRALFDALEAVVSGGDNAPQSASPNA